MSGVDPVTETITFADGHGFLVGDCVWYDPRDGASIIAGSVRRTTGTCSGGTPPTDRRTAVLRPGASIPNTIKLTTTLAAATAATTPPSTPPR